MICVTRYAQNTEACAGHSKTHGLEGAPVFLVQFKMCFRNKKFSGRKDHCLLLYRDATGGDRIFGDTRELAFRLNDPGVG